MRSDRDKARKEAKPKKPSRVTQRGMPRVTLDRHIVSELMRELVGDGRQPSAFLVYLALAAQVAGQRRRKVTASYQTIADETGLSRSAAQAAVQKLLERGLLRAERTAATAAPTYVVERPWLDRT